MNTIQRNRVVYLAAMLLCMALGLASRHAAARLPAFIAEYAGDTLWALAAFLGIGFLFPRITTLRAGLMSLAIAYAIEISQLYQAPWINQIRHTLIGGLILGFGFLWSDLVCYTVGIAAGAAAEVVWSRWSRGSGQE